MEKEGKEERMCDTAIYRLNELEKKTLFSVDESFGSRLKKKRERDKTLYRYSAVSSILRVIKLDY